MDTFLLDENKCYYFVDWGRSLSWDMKELNIYVWIRVALTQGDLIFILGHHGPDGLLV